MSAELEPEEGSIVDSKELGTIQIGRRIGQGGMGRVYEACRPNLPDATFAVKFLSPALLQDQESLERFATEARRLSELRHRNIVRVLGYGLTAYGPCIQMELLRGRPLSRLVNGLQGAVPDRLLACNVVAEVLDGLQRVHEKGLVHRDIKGDNIFLETSEGDVVVKLIDFGIVKETNKLTRATGAFVGTPAAAAPEQLMLQPVGFWTDIYQVGVLAYLLLSGRHPFEEAKAKGVAAVLEAHVSQAPPPLATVAPDVPGEIVEAVMAMLSKDPRQRVRLARDGRPDGSAKAFRSPFRSFVRDLEDQLVGADSTHTTQHRMLELVQTADARLHAIPAAGRGPAGAGALDPALAPVAIPRGTPPTLGTPGATLADGGSLPGTAGGVPLAPAGGNTVTFYGGTSTQGAGGATSSTSTATGLASDSPGVPPAAPLPGGAHPSAPSYTAGSNTTGPMSRTAPGARPGKVAPLAVVLIGVGVLAALGAVAGVWGLARHPTAIAASSAPQAASAAQPAAPASAPPPAPVGAGESKAAVEEPSATGAGAEQPSAAATGAGAPIVSARNTAANGAASHAPASKPPPNAPPAPRPKPAPPNPSSSSGALWGLDVLKNGP